MPTFGFGSGLIWGTPLTDAFGNSLANPTPLLVGVLQDASIDISFDVKELHGQNQFPEAIGRGKGKVTAKAKFARFNGKMINDLIFGQTLTTGTIADVYDTTGTAIPAGPYTITPTVPGSGTWTRDLGVRDASGNPMICVASAPATGQYSVAAGVYTFAAADTGKVVFICYQYTATSTTAKSILVNNVQMGNSPTFRMDFQNGYSGKVIGASLFNCIATKFSLPTKQDDFIVSETDISAFSDGAGRVAQLFFAE